MEVQFPDKWKWPKVDSYDVTSNSNAHVKTYMTQANLFFGDLRVHCRLFPITLKKPVLEWYYSLPQNLVDSFCTMFEVHNSVYRQQTDGYLLSLALACDSRQIWVT